MSENIISCDNCIDYTSVRCVRGNKYWHDCIYHGECKYEGELCVPVVRYSNFEPVYKENFKSKVEPEELSFDPYTTQVGGSHYNKKHDLAQLLIENKVGFGEGAAMKYIYRHAEKAGVEDLRKAQHFLQFLAYSIYGEAL